MSKLSVGEKVFISNASRNKKELLKNNSLNNFNSNDYMENSYSRILDNIEENTGLSGLVQKYNPNYKLKLKLIDEAIEKIGNTNRKKNSFNDTEISIIYTNKNNDNTSQLNDLMNNSNNNINDSKIGNNSNFIIPMNSNSKGKIPKGKKLLKIKYII